MNKRSSKPTVHILMFFALLTSLMVSAVSVAPAYATWITVNSNADTTADDGTCTHLYPAGSKEKGAVRPRTKSIFNIFTFFV